MWNDDIGIRRGIEILDMIITRSGTFNDQFRRPYETVATGETINAIQERFDQISGNVSSISSGLFDGIASNFVAPQATPGSGIIIPNGWGTERYFYILKVLIHNSLGGTSIDVIQGYSDFYDASFSGMIDPRTRFTINSITRVVNARQSTPYGVQVVGMVKEAHQVLANNNYSGPQDFAANSQMDAQVCMRPADVYSNLHSSEYASNLDLHDLRSINSGVPKISNRYNAIAANYTGSIVRGYADAVVKNVHSPGGGQLYSDAIGAVSDPTLSRNEFVKAIGNISGIILSNSFQLSDLYKLDPSLASSSDTRIKILQEQTMVQSYRSQIATGLPQAGHASHWHGADHETKAATILANGLPAMMVEVGFIHLVFMATNHSTMPIIETKWAAGIAENYDCRPFIQGLERRIQRELIDQLSYNGQVAYQIYADVKLAKSTEISLQFETRPQVEFISPTFADSLMSPVITTDRERLNNVASDFGTLVRSLVQVQPSSLEDLDSYANI